MPIHRKGFILTKWYVNYLDSSGFFICGDCFILTKWYVNKIVSNIKSLP